MNFKPLENEKQYKYAKKRWKDFHKQIIKLDNEIDCKKLQRKEIGYAKAIMEAEIQDYENRNFTKESIQ